MFSSVTLAAVSCGVALVLGAKPQAKPVSDGAEPRVLVQHALALLQQGKTQQTRFTRYHLEHNIVTNKDGREIANTSKLFEDTWINDLPYKRLVEFDGKPLTGKALAEEQARYDAALADHRALDAEERAKLERGKVISSGVDFATLTGPGYRLQMLKADDCNGTPCHELVADPVLAGPEKPEHPQHFEIWVADGAECPVKLRYELLTEEGDLKKGSTGLIEWQMFNGVPVTRHSLLVGLVRSGLHTIRIETDNTYDRYRRFSTTVTILPKSDGNPVP